MKLQVKRVDVWTGEMGDRPGGLGEKLAALSAARVSLDFVLARRCPEAPGKAVVFLSPIRGARQVQAAAGAGLAKAENIFSVRVEGPDRPGVGACMAEALAEAGLNLRGLSAAVIGKRFVAHIACDTAADADKVARILKACK
jgi:hypothetical protein